MAVEAEDLAARLRAEFPRALRGGQLMAYFQPEIELYEAKRAGGGCWRLFEDTESAGQEQAADPVLPTA